MTINQLAKNTGVILASQGIKMVKSGFDYLQPTEVSFGYIKTTLNSLGLDSVVTTEMDTKYYTSSWTDLSDCLNLAYGIVKNFPWTAEKFDCLLPDSPLICKINNEIIIKQVQELPEEPKNTYILDRDLKTGKITWTKLNWVDKKKSDKDIIVIHNPEGFLELTEDHRAYIQKRWYKVGELEKHNEFRRVKFTTVPKWDIFNNKKIDKDLAYSYGVFFAEGTAGCYKTKTTEKCYSWHVDMGEKDVLERVKIAFEKEFKVKLKIVLYPSQSKGSMRGGIKSTKDLFRLKIDGEYGKLLSSKFTEMFYTIDREKKVPLEILNSDKESQKEFLLGYIIGDGAKTNKKRESYLASCKSRIGLLGLQILSEIIGWSFSTCYDKRIYGKRKTCPIITFYPDGIKKTHNLITKENGNEPRSLFFRKQFFREKRGNLDVYDINTDSGHFFGGKLLIHNCDNRSAFMSVLCSIFGLTVGQFYGRVYDNTTGKVKYMHWWNGTIDKDMNLFMFDADCGGKSCLVLKNKPIIIDNNQYEIISCRFF
jgi:hypothetical protein